MRTTPLLFALLFAFLVAGCSKNPLVGTWEGSDPAMGAMATTFTFNGDNTYTNTVTLQGMALTFKGTYTLDGDKITLQPVTLDATGPLADQAKLGFESVGKQPRTGTVTFKDDTATLATNGLSTVLKRKS